jgi:hypothetical protein
MPPEFGGDVELVCALAQGALQALEQGNAAEHDRLIAAEAIKLRDQGCTRLALAQFSMARARAACQTATGLPVSTTVESAIRTLRKRLEVI